MKKIKFTNRSALFILLVFISGIIFGQSITVNVFDSSGDPVNGAIVKLVRPNGTISAGPTVDGSVVIVEPVIESGKTYGVYISDDFSTSQTQTLNYDGTDFTLNFSKVACYISVIDHNGNPIENARIDYGPGYYQLFGNTNNEGYAIRDLFPGNTLNFYSRYNHTTSATQTAVVVDGNVDPPTPTATFQTTETILHFSGSILINTNGLYTYNNPTEYFAGTWNFKFETGPWDNKKTGYLDIVVSGTTTEKTVAMLRLLDHDGLPLAGGTARGGITTPTSWFVSGSTNANGILMDIRPGNLSSYAYEMNFNSTSEWQGPKVPETDSYFEFQTNLLTLRLETCEGVPLDGGNPRWGNGSNYSSRWFPANPGQSTGTSAPGEVEGEVFPGTYSFEMQYKATSDRKISVVVPDSDYLLTWQTTKVSLYYSGVIAYGGSGDSRYFDQPTMELLPGTYTFNFRNGGTYADLTFSGCDFEKTVFVTTVHDCDAGLLSGVDVQWYKYGSAGTKYSVGTTGSTPLLGFIDGKADYNIVVVTEYLHRIKNTDQQNPYVDSFFDVYTELATAGLNDHEGNQICLTEENAELKVYSWGSADYKYDMAFESCLGEMCLLPGSYGFVLKYNDTQQTIAPITLENSDPDVEFQTAYIIDNGWGCTQYYQYGNGGNPTDWTENIELLPVRVIFKNSLNETQDIVLVAGNIYYLNGEPDPEENCSEGNMTVYFKDSYGDPMPGGVLEYKEGRLDWEYATEIEDGKFCIDTDRSTIKLKMSYYPQAEQEANVPTESDYTFQTELVTVELVDAFEDPMDGGFVRYTSDGWHDFGTTGDDGTGIVTMQMLPVRFTFQMNYDGKKENRLEIISPANNYISFSVNDLKIAMLDSDESIMMETYPNPFNTSTTISIISENMQYVKLSIYDLNGKLVKVIYDGRLDEGQHKIIWNSESVKIGTYILRMETESGIWHKRLIKM